MAWCWQVPASRFFSISLCHLVCVALGTSSFVHSVDGLYTRTEGAKVVVTVLGFLFVALWCYGLHRFVEYDHLNGVRNLKTQSGADKSR
jgi:hypothetical protein